MKINDVYTAYVSWPGGGKRRPVLILSADKENVLVFKITSKYKNKSKSIQKYYYKIRDLSSAGLYKKSYVDTITKINLSKDRIKFNKIGELSTTDIQNLANFISERS